MKKILVTVLMIFCLTSVFAGDGDHILTREEPSNFLLDVGLALVSPSGESDLRAGGVIGLTFTPAVFMDMAIGVKAQFTATANPGELKAHEEGIVKTIDFSAAGLLCGKYGWAKSFELYGALGARYDVYSFEDFSDFGQRWGLVLQGGTHGRQTNSFGVGVELEYYKTITEGADDELGVRAFISYEM